MLGVLHKELEEFVHTFGLEYFPSKDDIYRLTNSCSLCSKIEKNGGYIFVFNQSQISVGLTKSKWFAFENKFDFIDKFSDFYKKLEEDNGT